MELWFTERHTNGVNFSIKVDCQLFSGQSEFQKRIWTIFSARRLYDANGKR